MDKFFWVSASYGTPVIVNSPYNFNGVLEFKAGARITSNNITLVGGLENTLNDANNIPERFSPFLGPGYFFTDKLIFFSIHTGLSYPFYKDAPDYPQDPGLHSALDLGLRIASNVTAGIGLSHFIANDVNAFTLRFWFQINSE